MSCSRLACVSHMSRSERPRSLCNLAALAALVSAGLLLSGCAGLFNPYQRAGTWRPEQLAASNGKAMAADQRDLVSGVQSSGSVGYEAASAVARLRTDKVRDLPASGISKLVPIAFGASPGGGGGSGGEE